MTTTDPDDLEMFLAEQLRDPAFAAAFRDAQARSNLLAALVAERKAAGLTVDDVAARMNIRAKEVAQFENGGADPYLTFMYGYARAIGRHLTITF